MPEEERDPTLLSLGYYTEEQQRYFEETVDLEYGNLGEGERAADLVEMLEGIEKQKKY